jgi:hypothetical protein
MLPFASVFVTWTFAVPASCTWAGLLAVFVTRTDDTDEAIAEPQPVTRSTRVATDAMVSTVSPQRRTLLIKNSLPAALWDAIDNESQRKATRVLNLSPEIGFVVRRRDTTTVNS